MNFKSQTYIEFYNTIIDIAKHPVVLQMKNYNQHYNCTCYDHCLHVAYYSFLICKKLHLDATSMARAAMVHDLFLYNWRKRENGRKGFHAFTHGKTAYENASKLFSLNKKQKDIILKHMWPVTPIPPRYLESFIITLTDKYCALEESYTYYSEKASTKKLIRYASLVILCTFFHLP